MKSKNQGLCVHEPCIISTFHGHYTIPGSPVALARARYGNKRVWDSQKQIRTNAAILLANQHGNLPLFSGPLFIEICFYFEPASSLTLKKKEALYNTPHLFKPDLSNLVKFVEDVGSGVVYKDDCIISYLKAEKKYAPEAYSFITISES